MHVQRLSSLRSFWRNRSLGAHETFFTLGLAAYLDACPADGGSRYYDCLPDSNSLLLSHFGVLYQSLLGALSNALSSPVELTSDLAYPGFHIFRGQGIVGAGNSGRHFDVQYSKIRLPRGTITSDPVSFTLSLKLPVSGSGLEIWDFTVSDFVRAYLSGRASSVEEYADRRTRSYYSYSIGQLFMHRGLWLHRLNSPGVILADDERITLQGHALQTEGVWFAYW